MKQNKRIIDRLLEQARECTEQSQPVNESEELAEDSQHELKQIDFEPVFDFDVYIEIGDGRSDTIFMNESSNPAEQAHNFCQKHNLDPCIVGLLADSLAEQFRSEKSLAKISSGKTVSSHPQRLIGAEKLFNSRKTTGLRRHECPRPQEQLPLKPKINDVSEQIVSKMGKQNIIQSMNRKFNEKMHQHILETTESEAKEFENFSFHPKINPISDKVDKTLHQSRKQHSSRFEQLYERHKAMKSRHEEKRRNSMSQISFKPQINNVSRIIVEKKKSLGEINTAEKRKIYELNSSVENLKKSKSHERRRQRKDILENTEGKQFHLYEDARKRKEKLAKSSQKYQSQEKWQIIDSSNSLVHALRENRIREVFHKLSNGLTLNWHSINEKSLNEVQKIFIPIFKQMEEMEIQLNEEEFVQSGLRLIKYLTPFERGLLTKKNENYKQIGNCKENKVTVNRRSRELVEKNGYGESNIYMRGMLFKKEVKNQVEKNREDKVRRQLQTCTFKPKVNSIPQNIAY